MDKREADQDRQSRRHIILGGSVLALVSALAVDASSTHFHSFQVDH